jgi:tetratricopeptide (TPR) repeat protein
MLIKTARVEDALAAARRIEAPYIQSQVFLALAEEMDNADKTGEAKSTADEALTSVIKVEDSNDKVELCLAIARLMKKLKVIDKAKEAAGIGLDAASNSKADLSKADLSNIFLIQYNIIDLSNLTGVLADLGETDKAKRAADIIFKLVSSIDLESVEDQCLTAAANALIQAGETNKAFELLNKITDLNERCLLFKNAAKKLSEIQKLPDAKQAAHNALDAAKTFEKNPKIEDEIKTETLSQAARALTRIGDQDTALKLPTEFKEAGESAIKAAVADEMADMKNINGALGLIDGVNDEDLKASILIKSAKELITLNRITEAAEVANKAFTAATGITITEDNLDKYLLRFGQVAKVMFKLGRTDKAREAIIKALIAGTKYANPYSNVQYYMNELTRMLVEADGKDEALRIFDEVNQPETQFKYYAQVAKLLTLINKNEAEMIADKSLYIIGTMEAIPQARSLPDTAQIMLKIGATNKAREIQTKLVALATEKPLGGEGRSFTFAEAAKIQAKTGSLYQAHQIASQCSVPFNKLDAYTIILIEHIRQQDDNLATLFYESQEAEQQVNNRFD